MKSKLGCFVLVVTAGLLLGCTKSEDIANAVDPVIKSVECLQTFYKAINRLPVDNHELMKFVEAESLSLNLSQFKVFHYYQKTDSTLALDYVLMPPAEGKGTFEFQPGEKVDMR